MQGIARNFFTLAIIYGICGMALGLHMGMSDDHTAMPAHAHIMVAGWLMSAIFGFFYHLVPQARGMLATIHFWLTAISGIVFFVALYLLLTGKVGAEPVVAGASTAFFVGMLLFAAIALPAIWRRP
jgi:heme/copper-type cytochrome/quinol oxidase subunit 1